MRLVRAALMCCVCGFTLAACGGGGTTLTPMPKPTAEPTATAVPLRAFYVFAGDPSGKTTVEYGLTGTVSIATLSATGAPNAFAFDASGNIYVAFGGATVEEHAAGTHRLIRTIRGFHHVNDIALDTNGVLYVVDGPNASVAPASAVPSNLTKTMPGKTVPSAVLLSLPYNVNDLTLVTVAVDLAGTVYAGADNIYVFASGATAPTRIISLGGEGTPTALAFDRRGNLYIYGFDIVALENFSNIFVLAPGAKTPVVADPNVTFGTTPQSLALDVSGDLYTLSDPYIPYTLGPAVPGSVDTKTLGRPFNYPIAIAVDPLKNLYVLDADSVVDSIGPGPGEHIGEYAYSSLTPTRTFESSGTAIGLSSVP